MSNVRSENVVNAVVPFGIEPAQQVMTDTLGIASDPFFTQVYPADGGPWSGEGQKCYYFKLR